MVSGAALLNGSDLNEMGSKSQKANVWKTAGVLNSSDDCCSVAQSCLTLCELLDSSMPGFPVLHHLPEYAQTHIHSVSDAI